MALPLNWSGGESACRRYNYDYITSHEISNLIWSDTNQNSYSCSSNSIRHINPSSITSSPSEESSWINYNRGITIFPNDRIYHKYYDEMISTNYMDLKNTTYITIGKNLIIQKYLTYKLSNKNIMSTLKGLAKRLVDADTNKLVKANLLDSCLNLTNSGIDELLAILFEANKTKMVDRAKEILKKDEEEE